MHQLLLHFYLQIMNKGFGKDRQYRRKFIPRENVNRSISGSFLIHEGTISNVHYVSEYYAQRPISYLEG